MSQAGVRARDVHSQGHNLEDCFTKLQEMVNAAAKEPKVRKINTDVSKVTKVGWRLCVCCIYVQLLTCAPVRLLFSAQTV